MSDASKRFEIGDEVEVVGEGRGVVTHVDPDDDVVPYMVSFDGRESNWIDASEIGPAVDP